MPYIIQTDDNEKPMLVDYNTGCGCCAEHRAVNVDEDDTFLKPTFLAKEQVEEAVKGQLHALAQWTRQLQQYAVDHDLDLTGD